jgi:hypothetical protein
LEILEKPFASSADKSRHPIEPVMGFGGIAEMEHTKLQMRTSIEHESDALRIRLSRMKMSAVRSAGTKAVRKKAASRNTKPVPPLRKKMGSESKSTRLVGRYCGSEDLAPSFIKRRDRRCRKCFSKRYGSAARARTPKVKK